MSSQGASVVCPRSWSGTKYHATPLLLVALLFLALVDRSYIASAKHEQDGVPEPPQLPSVVTEHVYGRRQSSSSAGGSGSSDASSPSTAGVGSSPSAASSAAFSSNSGSESAGASVSNASSTSGIASSAGSVSGADSANSTDVEVNETSGNFTNTSRSATSSASQTIHTKIPKNESYTQTPVLDGNETDDGNATDSNATRTQEITRTVMPPPPSTPIPTLNGDDLLDNYDYFGAMILDVSNLAFNPDTFAETYLAPALVDKTFVIRTKLLDWCGLDKENVPGDWYHNPCLGVAENQIQGVMVKFTFAGAKGQMNYTTSNVDLTLIPSIARNADGKEYYAIVKYQQPRGTEAPGVLHRATETAGSPIGIVIILLLIIVMAVIVYFVVRRLWSRSKNATNAAAASGSDRAAQYAADPPAPGRTEFEMTSPPPAPGTGGGGASPPPQAPKEAAPSPSHQTREMDVAY